MADLFSYWIGPVSWIERLTVQSAQRTGHTLTIYSHDDIRPLADALGCEVKDARTLPFADRLNDLRHLAPQHYSDHFRIEGIATGLGTWSDLDVVFLKHLPDDPYLFGWQGPDRIGNSILRLPRESAVLRDYLDFCRKRPMVRYALPWFSLRRKLTRTLKGLLATLYGAPRPELKYGPVALTHFLKRHRHLHLAKPTHVFYPIPTDARSVRAFAHGDLRDTITRDTVAVHLWRSTLSGCLQGQEPKGWLAEHIYSDASSL